MSGRYAFYISDSTGITSETLGNALLPLFEGVEFNRVFLPYTDTLAKAHEAVKAINRAAEESGARPLIFGTIINAELQNVIAASGGLLLDIMRTFLPALEAELGPVSSYQVGRSHARPTDESALQRMSAIDFALQTDDGVGPNYYKDADVILIGVSRSAKTPTCLYIAMQYGIKAANWPLTEEDLERGTLPATLQQYRSKLFGLTLPIERLSKIRQERLAESRYASVKQCQWELREAELIYRKCGIPFIDTGSISIEEIATHIIVDMKLKRQSSKF